MFWYMENVIFWGAGNTTALWWDDMERANIRPMYIVDSFKKVGGGVERYRDIPLLSPDELRSLSDSESYKIILMSTSQNTVLEIREQLVSMQIPFREVVSCAEEYYTVRWDDCESVLALLHDDVSKQTMREWLKTRMGKRTGLPSELLDYHGYFSLPAFRGVARNEIFVDCGAYVGDTLEKYLFDRFGMFQKYYAFEPFPENYNALKCRVQRLEQEWNVTGKIICENMALDSGVKTIFVSNEVSNVSAMVSEDASCGVAINAVSLDQYFECHQKETIGCIKADIEGSEINMLKGAEKTIREQKPKLAISLYHKPGDIIDIIRLIHEYREDYIFDMRCCYTNGTDLVLYAY